MSDWQTPGRRVVVAASEKPAGARRRHLRGGLRLLGVGALIQCLAWLASLWPQVAQRGSLLPLLLPVLLVAAALEVLGLFRLILGLIDFIRGRINK